MKAIDAKKRLEEIGPFDIEVNEEYENLFGESMDEGMRAKLISVEEERDEADEPVYYRLLFDMTDFVEYNKTKAKNTWYDSNRNATLTWFETSMYPKNNIEKFYCDPQDDIFEELEESQSTLYSEWLISDSTLTYVRWLEEEVYHHRIEKYVYHHRIEKYGKD